MSQQKIILDNQLSFKEPKGTNNNILPARFQSKCILRRNNNNLLINSFKQSQYCNKQSYTMENSQISGLSPMEFLRGFNQMTEQFDKSQSVLKLVRKNAASQLTLFKRFPIPDYYNEMEGLTVDIKEKAQIKTVRYNKFNKKDQKFKKKHNALIKRVLNDMIQNNIKHMKVLQKNQQFYKNYSISPPKQPNRAKSLNAFQKSKKVTKQKSSNEQKLIFPSLNFKTLLKDRIKSPFMISFSSQSRPTKSNQKSNCKLRDLQQVNMLLMKRKSCNLSIISNKPQQQVNLKELQIKPRKQSVVSVMTQRSQKTQKTRKTRKSQKIFTQRTQKNDLSVKIVDTKSSEQTYHQINNLMNPQKYIKSKFSNPLNVVYDYDKKLKRMSDSFRDEIVHHYAYDFKE